MTRLIDADALLGRLGNLYVKNITSNNMAEIVSRLFNIVKAVITNAPTVEREGWKLVPIEPTDEMKRALFKNLIHADDEAYVIKAIIAAAPDKE